MNRIRLKYYKFDKANAYLLEENISHRRRAEAILSANVSKRSYPP